MKCTICDNSASYRNKLGELYCYEHYWTQIGYNKPTGELFTDNNVYRSCPACGSGDLCDTGGCIAKCSYCKIIDENRGEIYCSEKCKNLAEKEEEERRNQENSKWCSFCSNLSTNIKRKDYPDKFFCRDCFLKRKPDLKLPSKRILRKRKKNLKGDWVCPHYEAEFNDELIDAVRDAEKERIIKSYWLPEWKPIMKNKEKRNICADCYHDSAEYLFLVQELTAKQFSKVFSKLSSANQKIYEDMKNCSFETVEDFEENKEELRKEVININSNDDQYRERERERERAKLNYEIKELQKKPNRTPEEDKELEDLRKKLKDLGNKKKDNLSTNSFDYTPYLIGGSCLLVLLFLIFIAIRKKKKH